MRQALVTWITDADELKYVDEFRLPAPVDTRVGGRIGREDDLYVALVGELFDRLREAEEPSSDWSLLGNALADFGFFGNDEDQAPEDASLFAAAAFYFGGFSASAYLTLRDGISQSPSEGHGAAFELLARPASLRSPRVRRLVSALREGDLRAVAQEEELAGERAELALEVGPEEWVGWRLYQEIVRRFATTNVRAVLPVAGDAEFWDALVQSLLSRTPPVWDFFPSQIAAIRRGLIEAAESFSLQMPTGSGKTALTETLMFAHLKNRPDESAILLVPYRALAAELRTTLVPRMSSMGFPSRSAYGGAVPTGDELQDLDEVRALVVTPETLSGMLSANPGFFQTVSLVICDEGHLLDEAARGVSLELLLARMKAREAGPPRFVFVSAIVPNIEEINSWLGGNDQTVVRSDYRPALAEFAMLRQGLEGVALDFHPHEQHGFQIEGFLSRDDFRYLNPATGRQRTYSFTTYKTQAVAAARKALPMGAVAVFAANKRGNQGCIGLARELLAQLDVPISLPKPIRHAPAATETMLQAAVDYLTLEYGSEWVGTESLRAGAMLHHGDIPQETREVLEYLMRTGTVRLAFCTSTLAEGVNLPLRTLVLYSVTRRLSDGTPMDLRARDIKNLVGRAGRAGATTKGLVICANSNQWQIIEPVARQQPGEPVRGALLLLMERVQRALARGQRMTNGALESTPELHPLIDGVDSTLIDLAVQELGEDELVRLASELSTQTYAAQEAEDNIRALMREVFELRARRMIGIRDAGRLSWIRETGARARMLDAVENGLLGSLDRWDNIDDPTDPALVEAVLEWAWAQFDADGALDEVFRDAAPNREELDRFVSLWIAGYARGDIAIRLGFTMDDSLAFLSRIISYELHAAAEQGIALLSRFCEARGEELSPAVAAFPDHLRFGVPNAASRLIAGRVRHRRAAVALGTCTELRHFGDAAQTSLLGEARRLLDDTDRWLPVVGRLVLDRTRLELQAYVQGGSA
jgi:hypothetical protein